MSAPRWPRRMHPRRGAQPAGPAGRPLPARHHPDAGALPAAADLRAAARALPALEVEPWEDQTTVLLKRLRGHELDAALLATEVDGPDSQPTAVRRALPRGAAARAPARRTGGGGGRDLAPGHPGPGGRALPARPDAGGLRAQRRAGQHAARIEPLDPAQHGRRRLRDALLPGLAAGAAQDAGSCCGRCRPRRDGRCASPGAPASRGGPPWMRWARSSPRGCAASRRMRRPGRSRTSGGGTSLGATRAPDAAWRWWRASATGQPPSTIRRRARSSPRSVGPDV